MRKYNIKNERIKRKYFIYLEEAKRLSVKSVDNAAAAIALYEKSIKYRDFAAFHIEQPKKFKRELNEAVNPNTGKPLAKATIRSRLKELKAFFHFLAGQSGYKSRISYSDCDYFNQNANDGRIAQAVYEKPIPTLKQIQYVLETLPYKTDIEKRDRALIAFTLLSGARDDAIASMKLCNVDLTKRLITQDARYVRTKFRKSINTAFFPVGGSAEKIVTDWIEHLKSTLLFSEHDPLFPSTQIVRGKNNQFTPVGITRTGWKNAGAIRRIFKASFKTAGLPYYNPHSFRNTLVRLGQQICGTPEEFKAWSQNLGHEQVMTTFLSYGKVETHRQAEIIQKLGQESDTISTKEPDAAMIAAVVQHLQTKANLKI